MEEVYEQHKWLDCKVIDKMGLCCDAYLNILLIYQYVGCMNCAGHQ